MINWLKMIWHLKSHLTMAATRNQALAEHLKDVIIRLSALEGKSESGTVKSRLDNLTIRVESLEKGEG